LRLLLELDYQVGNYFRIGQAFFLGVNMLIGAGWTLVSPMWPGGTVPGPITGLGQGATSSGPMQTGAALVQGDS
jgi:hypothetical protein